MKKILSISLVLFFFLSLSVPSAFAGSKERHRWQGAAMALGAVILGNALYNSCQYEAPTKSYTTLKRSRTSRYDYQSCPPRHHRQGRWEYRKVWVEPVCERVWNPGHYNNRHCWIPGQYIMVEREPGYWKTERIWVGCR